MPVTKPRRAPLLAQHVDVSHLKSWHEGEGIRPVDEALFTRRKKQPRRKAIRVPSTKERSRN